MSNIWFQSDFHFNHENIIKYCNRPFKNVNEMNNIIIKRHNERVKKEDTVYFLGDFGFFASKNRSFRGEGKPYNPDQFLSQMNGKYWGFVKGNHDKSSNKWHPISDEIILNQNGLRIQLIHDSLYGKVDYSLILCGHHHNKFKLKELFYLNKISLIINCSCDVWNFYPVRLDEVLSIYYKWKKQREKINRWAIPEIITEMNKNYGN